MRSRASLAILVALLGLCMACSHPESTADAQAPTTSDGGVAVGPGLSELAEALPEGSPQKAALADGMVETSELTAGLQQTQRCVEDGAQTLGAQVKASINDGRPRPTLSYEVIGGTDGPDASDAALIDLFQRCELLHSGLLEMVLDGASTMADGRNVVLDEMRRLGITS